MSSERSKERYRQWKLANPLKVQEQNLRRGLRRNGLLPAYVKPEPKLNKSKNLRRKERLESDPIYAAQYKTKQRERDRLRYAKLKADPVAYAKKLECERIRKRVKNGVPLDKPIKQIITPEDRIKSEREKARRKKSREYDRLRYQKRKTDPEAHAAWLAYKRERSRIRNCIKRGIPVDSPLYTYCLSDEVKAKRAAEKERRQAERAAKQPKRIKLSDEERRQRRLQSKREYDQRKRDQERQKRAAEILEAKANQNDKSPAFCPDPPELQALFKKAAKGEPVRPIVHHAKKRSVFHLRGYC